jgi:hypothetical protein
VTPSHRACCRVHVGIRLPVHCWLCFSDVVVCLAVVVSVVWVVFVRFFYFCVLLFV